MINSSLQYFAPVGQNRFKTVTIHEFPNGCEVFIDENKESFSDGTVHDIDLNAPEVKPGVPDLEANRERAGRRSKTQVRRKCKMISADCMMTLTYRCLMLDRVQVERDFRAFRQRLERFGQFLYVAVLEEQKRGALHVHIACNQFPAWLADENGARVRSYGLISSIWSRVIGRGNGNVNFTKPRGNNSAHRIASYIGKYVSKAITGTLAGKKSYWASKGIKMPSPVRLYFPIETDTFDLVAMCAQEFILRGFNDIAQYSDRLNEFHWFAASKSARQFKTV